MADVLAELRREALGAFSAAIGAVQPWRLIPAAIQVTRDHLVVGELVVERGAGHVVVAALGKAAGGLAEAWLGHAPDWCDRLFVLAPHGVAIADRVAVQGVVRHGRHPTPDAAGVTATEELLALAGGLGRDDLLLVLLSGGASALLAAPAAGLELADVQAATRALLAAGAPIGALNTVRRALLAAAGGGLARAALPARVVTLAVSDVLGDRLADIASGPTVPSPTGAADALAVLDRFGVAAPAVARARRALGAAAATTASDPTAGCQAVVLANNHTAVTAAQTALAECGWTTAPLARPLTGEARTIGSWLGALARSARPSQRLAILAGGETTVTVRGRGRGGRNQELALAAALALEHHHEVVLLAAGTDGVDGASANAGGLVDATTAGRLRTAGIDPSLALAANDTATALAAIGDTIVTGPTGTNVCDLVVILLDRRRTSSPDPPMPTRCTHRP